MNDSNVLTSAHQLEQVNARTICLLTFVSMQDTIVSEPCLGISSHMAFFVWTVMDVDMKGPVGGQHLHLLWMLLFLKEYCKQETLSGICGVKRMVFHYWVDQFVDCASNINLVS